jgi:hypothetical protein
MYNRCAEPINALTEDWDNLLILDACRYDVFADLSDLPGELTPRFSPASGTMEWLQKTIDGHEYHDTVYVTANPRVNRYEEHFFEVVPAWRSHWDDDLKVTPPEAVADLTRRAIDEYPDKRVVGHFMQPHIPFIGEFGRSEIGIHDGTTKGVNQALGNDYTANVEPYVLLREGKLDSDAIRKAYRENLQIVLSVLDSLFGDLHGKTVVTSDHGEMFGEVGWPIPRRRYGHPYHTAARKLHEVPWLTYHNGPRREVTAGTPGQIGEGIDEEEIQERLEHLGYR